MEVQRKFGSENTCRKYLEGIDEGLSERPDYELTYDKLKEYDFDPNASILLALDVMKEMVK